MLERNRSYFALSDSKLDIKKLKQELENPKAGALVTFEGWVRNHNDGRSVERLDYEAFEALAEAEGNRIIAEALERFEIEDAVCLHRTGRLIIGDCAVWVGASSAHRDAAFQAARYMIDAIKTRLPIWKKEHYKDGEAVWVNCQHCTHPQADSIEFHAVSTQSHPKHEPDIPPVSKAVVSEAEYYQRQTILPQIGADGQRKLKEARVLVIGAGGLGSTALLYLAGAGVGHLGICEFDQLEVSNLHRQVIYTAVEIGQPKVNLASQRLRELNPNIQIEVYGARLDEQSLSALLRQYDLVLDCTDNFKTRFQLNSVAVLMQKPLIQASVYQYEGQIQMVAPGLGGCLRCQWPELSEQSPLADCTQHGVLGAVSGLFGTLQAMEAIKWIVGLPTPLQDHLLIMDLLTYEQRLIRRAVQPDCPVCGRFFDQRLGVPKQSDVDDEVLDTIWQLEFNDASLRLTQFSLIDVNEAREHTPIPDLTVQNIPFSRFELDHPPPLDKERKYLLYCSKGVRSAHLVRELRKRGYQNVFALAGGLAKQDLTDLRRRELEGASLFYVHH